MKTRRRETWPFFVPRSSNYNAFSASNPSSSSARTFTNSERETPPLMGFLTQSPSPICSRDDSTPLATATQTCYSVTNYSVSDNTTEFTTPRNQSFWIIACEDNTVSTCISEIDEWLEHANKFCKSSFQTNHQTETVNLRRNENPQEEELRTSAICKTFLTASDDDLYNITLPSVREESPAFRGQSRLACINKMYGASKSGSNEHQRLITRHETYDPYLSEVRRHKMEAERDARKKVKHVELMHRMRRKEDAIDDLEMRKTRKAMDQMDTVQSELERKLLMASIRTQRKLCLVREKAEKQKLKLRRSTMKRFQQLQISETDIPAQISRGSRLPLC